MGEIGVFVGGRCYGELGGMGGDMGVEGLEGLGEEFDMCGKRDVGLIGCGMSDGEVKVVKIRFGV